jgi:hypothetical protein
MYYAAVPDAASAIAHLEDYRPPVSESKWL